MALFEINIEIERPHPDLVADLARLPVAMLSDAMANLHTMDSGVRMMVPGKNLCGPAVTAVTRAGDFVAVLKALQVARRGDVLVIDNQSQPDTAMWGEITTMEAQLKGVQGLVVDGLVRDIADIRRRGFPVFARGTTPRVAGRNNLGEVNVVVQCGGVVVTPGDIVVGDEDGVVVVPRRKMREVLLGARAILDFEDGFKQKIEAGHSQVELFELDQLMENIMHEFTRKWA
jgi:4-hydroxy-4-methyl-2-oxoglutarate aldolase